MTSKAVDVSENGAVREDGFTSTMTKVRFLGIVKECLPVTPFPFWWLRNGWVLYIKASPSLDEVRS